MSEVKRFDHVNHAHVDDCAHIENPGGAWVKASDYDALAAEAQALREEVARSEQHRNDQADLIVSLRTEVAALKHSQQVLIGSRNAHRDERDAARKEVAELRMARDDFKLERDLARQNFCDEQAANYQLQAHLKACLGELSELRARVVVDEDGAFDEWWEGSGFTKYRETAMAAWEARARLNGKTVSEGLLRRLTADPDYEEVFTMDRGEALTELLDLLNQDKENGNG
ncbi:TPA: hypothetical protein SH370_003572 [Pseudomonas aeruginosa]|nr:hypothetical protein [Pseudomonas aeruginosa]